MRRSLFNFTSRSCRRVLLLLVVISLSTFLMCFVLFGELNQSPKFHILDRHLTSFISRRSQQNINEEQVETIEILTGNSGVDSQVITQNKQEIRHVFFLKVHKAGSSTGMNIIMRFALSRNLTLMIPKEGNSFSQTSTLNDDQILDYKPNNIYDIVCNHVIFEKKKIARVMPPDTKYIGTVRHPFSQFVSAFLYYRNKFGLTYLRNIPGPNPITTYLMDPLQYETNTSKYSSFTNNRMSLDYGVTFNDTKNMQRYVARLDKEFDFIIVVEKFDESLVLMKRLLGWKTKDILYIQQKKRRDQVNTTDLQKSLHKKWARLDYILYKHFKDKLDRLLAAQDEAYHKELAYFKTVLLRTQKFCDGVKLQPLVVLESQWGANFTVTNSDCFHMKRISRLATSWVRRMYLNKGKMFRVYSKR